MSEPTMDILSSIKNLVNWKLRKWHKIFIIGKQWSIGESGLTVCS